MADMTREVAIERLKSLKITHIGDFGWDTRGIKALEMAISDMKRAEELENENKDLKSELDFKTVSKVREREMEIANEVINKLEAENKRLKDGIEKAKAEIEGLANTDFIPGTFVNGVTECKDIINKYLGE